MLIRLNVDQVRVELWDCCALGFGRYGAWPIWGLATGPGQYGAWPTWGQAEMGQAETGRDEMGRADTGKTPATQSRKFENKSKRGFWLFLYKN